MRNESQKTASGRTSHRTVVRRRAAEPERDATRIEKTVKDINVVRGDDRPQAVRHQR